MAAQNHERVITYIDGFNLYFGLKAAGYRRFYWLDMQALSQNLLKPLQSLVGVKYFTARITSSTSGRGKQKRQTDFLDALGTRSLLTIFEGHYLNKTVVCRRCGSRWNKPEEKMTDVNIASELLVDAFEDAFDTAIIVSADSDLTPPIKAIKQRFPEKRIIVAFPPKRWANQLKRAADESFPIGRGKLSQSQLPETVTLSSGYMVRRPESWA